MRSRRAFIAAATIVLSYPAALAVEQLFGGGAPTVIHFAAGAFGGIFLLQGVSDVTLTLPSLNIVVLPPIVWLLFDTAERPRRHADVRADHEAARRA